MNGTYHEIWEAKFQECIANHDPSGSIVAFLHPPKTGGSTVQQSMQASNTWNFFTFHTSQAIIRGDIIEEEDDEIVVCSNSVGTFLKFGHDKYSAIQWLRDSLQRRGLTLDRAVISVRPIRQRLVSMFQDYWTQVENFELGRSNDPKLRPRLRRKLKAFHQDSMHYRDRAGNIDGRNWFEAFSKYGSGIEFYMDDIFDGSLETFRHALVSGSLEAVRTDQIDAFLHSLTGRSEFGHERVSRKEENSPASVAIADSADIIDRLCEIDLPYDNVIEAYFQSERRDLSQKP